jgi:hypothetical protein
MTSEGQEETKLFQEEVRRKLNEAKRRSEGN